MFSFSQSTITAIIMFGGLSIGMLLVGAFFDYVSFKGAGSTFRYIAVFVLLVPLICMLIDLVPNIPNLLSGSKTETSYTEESAYVEIESVASINDESEGIIYIITTTDGSVYTVSELKVSIQYQETSDSPDYAKIVSKDGNGEDIESITLYIGKEQSGDMSS